MKNPATGLALEFANHLILDRFDCAHGLLSCSEAARITVEELKEAFLSMGSYDGGRLTESEAMDALLEWPAKLPDDICTFYIALSGRSATHEGWINEAVAGVLKTEKGRICIHSLEWGRP